MFKSTHSLLLAGVSRRTFLKTSAALGLGAVASPAIVSNALSSSGELSILNWDDELPDPVVPDFEKATGIKVNSTPFSQNEEQINKLQATSGVGFDLCQPTHDRAPQFRDIGVLQPFDDKIVKLDLIVPSLLKASTTNWTWDGKLYHVPHCWGTEAISWRNDLTTIKPEELSFGTLWNDEYKGKVQGRPHSLLLGIGLWMDGTGKLPSNRMLDAFKNEDEFKKIYDVILKEAIDRKAWIKQFWDSADNTKSGLISNGVVIGQTWDGPVISLKKSGKPISYQAPKEGAIGWVDGWSLSKGAKNVEQAPVTTPQGSAPTNCFRIRRAAFSMKPIPAPRSTKCGGAQPNPHGLANCVRNMRRNIRRPDARWGSYLTSDRLGRACPGHSRRVVATSLRSFPRQSRVGGRDKPGRDEAGQVVTPG
jgi:spermidine/putrescine transport system substrate-binding protein